MRRQQQPQHAEDQGDIGKIENTGAYGSDAEVEKVRDGAVEADAVKDIGGTECQKCHY